MYKIKIIFQNVYFNKTKQNKTKQNKRKQNNNETKIIKNKNKEKYSERTIQSWLGRTYDYNYVNSNNSKPSLPCPALGRTCGLFPNFF